MPPTREMVDKAIACLGETTLVNFSANKTTIRAGESVTISWDVDVPQTCGLSVRLNFAQVPKKGSRMIRPVRDVSFRLDAGAAGVSKLLGVVNVAVDTTACMQQTIPEDLIVPEVLETVDITLAEYNANPENADHKVSKRRETAVQIENDGIDIKLRLKLQINNFFDPDVDVDARIDVGVASDGQVIAFYRNFSVDVDWPWWVTGITLGISKIVEEFVEDAIEGTLKQRILNDLRSGVQTRVNQIPGVVANVDAVQDAIVITVCSETGNSVLGEIIRPMHDLILTPS